MKAQADSGTKGKAPHEQGMPGESLPKPFHGAPSVFHFSKTLVVRALGLPSASEIKPQRRAPGLQGAKGSVPNHIVPAVPTLQGRGVEQQDRRVGPLGGNLKRGRQVPVRARNQEPFGRK